MGYRVHYLFKNQMTHDDYKDATCIQVTQNHLHIYKEKVCIAIYQSGWWIKAVEFVEFSSVKR